MNNNNNNYDDDDDDDDLVSNDPEVERLGANATAVYALQHWKKLTTAARRDAYELDPLWSTSCDSSCASENESDNNTNSNNNNNDSSCRHVKQIILTKSDDADIRLWKRFRSNFSTFMFDVKDIRLPSLLHDSDNANSNNNPLVSERWRNLLMACEGMVDDYNLLTLLRPNAHTILSFTEQQQQQQQGQAGSSSAAAAAAAASAAACENSNDTDLWCIVPRAQFLFIEIARIREGHCYNATFRRALQQFDCQKVAHQLDTWRRQFTEDNINNINTTTTRDLTRAVQELQTWWPSPPSSRILQASGVIKALKQVLAVVEIATTTTTTTNTSTNTNATHLHDACQSLWQQWHDVATLGHLRNNCCLQIQMNNNNNNHHTHQYEQRQVAALERAARALTTTRQTQQQQQQHGGASTSSSSSSSSLSKVIITQSDVTCANVTSVSCRDSSKQQQQSSSSRANTGGHIMTVGTSSSSFSSLSVHDIFQKHGMVILPDYLIPNNNNSSENKTNKQRPETNVDNDDFLQLHIQQAKESLEHLSVALQTDFGVKVDGLDEFDFVEVRQRPGHRVDYRYDIKDDDNNIDMNSSSSRSISSSNPTTTAHMDLAQRLVEELPRLLFNKQEQDVVKLRVLHAGVVHAFGRHSADEPVPPAQIWHRDGPSLFTTDTDTDHQRHHHRHHDTHCFNVFIPLVNVDIPNGTTQFVPGTHVDAVYNELAPEVVLLAQQHQQSSLSSSSLQNNNNSVQEVRQHERAIAAIVPAGTVIIFDIRLLHRGLSNTMIHDSGTDGNTTTKTTADRPLLYFTLARDWFREEHMFQQQSSLNQDRDTMEEMQRLCTQLYQTVTGQTSSSSSSSSPLLQDNGYSTNNNKHDNSNKYGHPHYTLRFDLLLLEAVMALNIKKNSEKERTRLITTVTSAILAFNNRSTSDKIALCHEWIQVLARPESINCKLATLAEASQKRRQREQPGATMEQDYDFTNIQQDMSDVATLYRLTARLLLGEETTLLSRLGFPANEFSVCFTLSLLKAWAASSSQSDCINTDINVDDMSNNSTLVARLEESFSSWWHAGKSRFDFQHGQAQTRNERSQRMILVVFSSLGSGIARPEWKGSIRQSISTEDDGYINTAPTSSIKWDVLHVLDPSFSWYTQDPACCWHGYDYYSKQLETLLAHYKGVFYLGDSMGAAAALRFSLWADAVLAFTPQVDITSYEAITRADLSLTVRQRFQQELLYAVSNTKAKITIHYGKDCAEDVRQVGLLPSGEQSKNIKLVSHDFDDHVLSLHLRDQGLLTDMVKEAIEDFAMASLK